MTKENIIYAGVIPLIGGMLFGAEKVLSKKPEYILSYKPFYANDELYLNYLNASGATECVYSEIDENADYKHVSVVVALCPCAGLSQLNCSKSRGSEAPQNEWLYKSTEIALSKIKPEVLIGENAPALYDGKHGAVVLQRLKEIGKKHGYSMSIVKTNSYLHGIPQNRKRSFYFFWRFPLCPTLNFSDDSSITDLSTYLNTIPKSKLEDGMNAAINELRTCPEFRFITSKYGEANWRDNASDNGYSLLEYIIHNVSLAEYLDYLIDKEYDDKYIQKIKYIKGKLDSGLNFRDWSPHISRKFTNSLTGARMNIIHPVENRLLTIYELRHLMGIPDSVNEITKKDHAKLFQNVPSTTAAYWINEAVEAICGRRTYSICSFLKQNNIKKIFD
jgi:site-specific DNA-cytosine methylase